LSAMYKKSARVLCWTPIRANVACNIKPQWQILVVPEQSKEVEATPKLAYECNNVVTRTDVVVESLDRLHELGSSVFAEVG
jgi:IMP cyclohydrolase